MTRSTLETCLPFVCIMVLLTGCELLSDTPGWGSGDDAIGSGSGDDAGDASDVDGACAPVEVLSCGSVVQGDTADFNTGATTEIDAYAGAVGNYPHSYWVETMRDEVNAGCTDEEAAPLADCIRENCGDVPQDELANCGLANCGDEFSATSTECQTCVASNLDKDIDGILEACSGGGAAFSYSGRNGLILLSKTPLDNTQHTMLSSTLVQRAALRADVNVEGVGQVSVYCTHLAADLSGAIAYPGEEFASFEAEQAAQIGELIAWIDGQDNIGPIAWMGDFNTGPAGNDGVVAELPANYQLIVDSGYVSAFVEEGVCTYCDENTVGDDTPGTGGALIDHVFLKGLTASGVERSYDQKQTITTSEGEMELHLSDHYGVTVFISP